MLEEKRKQRSKARVEKLEWTHCFMRVPRLGRDVVIVSENSLRKGERNPFGDVDS